MSAQRKQPKELVNSEQLQKQDMTLADASLPPGYKETLNLIKLKVRSSRLKASVSVNSHLILLYWEIGDLILNRQNAEGWGSKVIDRMSFDLLHEFPGQKGFSVRNLKYMRKFAESYPDIAFVQQAAAQIPWFHHCTILDKVRNAEQREWYIMATLKHGWSRAVLHHQIESDLFARRGEAITNFSVTLPPEQSDLAQQLLKDPYCFDFLDVTDDVSERHLEKKLIEHLKDFLIELGNGFAFVGQQYRLDIGGEDYYIDLLFYHLRLRCYFVVELKVVPFKPEFVGKMNFYLSAIDAQMKHADDQPSIGLILCKDRVRLVVEYALRDTTKPMGVATYTVLPGKYAGRLPTPAEIQEGMEKYLEM